MRERKPGEPPPAEWKPDRPAPDPALERALRDEEQTERQAPETASPGESSGA